ncbi:hypothetical protein [Streptomyces abikoensis]
MNSAPHLLTEDRPEFERVLDQALRTANHDPQISALAAAIGQRLNTEQLRSMALSAMTAISACAMTEYQDFVRAREEQRAWSATARPPAGEDDDPTGAPSPSLSPSDVPEDPGAGAGAVVVVLAPVLAGIAAFLFLLIGYVLRTVGSNGAVADPIIKIGWWFGGFTVAAVLIASSGMLVTAVRNGRQTEETPRHDGLPDGYDQLSQETERAREAWRQALLDRGILPFLRESLANTPAAQRRPPSPRNRPGPGRTPQLGYSRPGFSSPDDGRSSPTRTGFTSPDYTGPEFGGPAPRQAPRKD